MPSAAQQEARRAVVLAHRVHRRRKRLEAAVEAALALLDALDEDAELEDGFDREDDRSDWEPELGWRHEDWTIGGRLMSQVHGCEADPMLDADDVPDTGEPRTEWGMVG